MKIDIVDRIMESPQLNLYLEKIHEKLADEQRRRAEFFETITEDDKAEFINGEIVIQSPAKYEHNTVSGNLFALMTSYVKRNDVGWVGAEKVFISLTRNDYEPDICFFRKSVADKFKAGQMRFPAPDLIVEVLSPSTKDRDRGVKFIDYAAHGVREYWIIDPVAQVLEQYLLLETGEYDLALKSDSGSVKSTAIPGFEIPIRAVFDANENIAALEKLLKQSVE